VTFELIKNLATLALITACFYVALSGYLHRTHSAWSAFLARRRFGVLLSLILAVIAVEVSEDAVTGESGPIDELVLRFIHAIVPPQMIGVFEAATMTGSAYVLVPLAVVIVIALVIARRRFEALLLAASVGSAAFVVYVLKAVVDRSRPDLWETRWYWGSSFPSGHTLVVAAFAAAAAIDVSRIWPGWRTSAWVVASAWVTLVAISRLVLGVHWPTDVLAAACIGAFLPLAAGIAIEFRSR
jgi:undecaprenyl-diphosphatase